MGSFKANVIQNPMLIEALRMGRKFFGVSRVGKASAVFIWLGAVIYALLFMTVLAFRRDMSSEGIILCQTGLFCFLLPAITYGAISGEREKRSWDLLIVAPVSKSQIVLGKFLSSALIVVFTAAA